VAPLRNPPPQSLRNPSLALSRRRLTEAAVYGGELKEYCPNIELQKNWGLWPPCVTFPVGVIYLQRYSYTAYARGTLVLPGGRRFLIRPSDLPAS
jgi:hypothetical protein